VQLRHTIHDPEATMEADQRDYDSQLRALMTVEEFATMQERYILGELHHRSALHPALWHPSSAAASSFEASDRKSMLTERITKVEAQAVQFHSDVKDLQTSLEPGQRDYNDQYNDQLRKLMTTEEYIVVQKEKILGKLP
jgi:hypothetical protein